MSTEATFAQLKEDYRETGIALALGAGVSYGCNLPNWHGLLKKIAERSKGPIREKHVKELVAAGYSLPSIASILESSYEGEKTFTEIIRGALYEGFSDYYRKDSPMNRPAEFARYIKCNNPTLSSVAALCAQRSPDKKKYIANSLIHAIANTNFDGLLSAYAKARFRRRLLRTIDRPSATVKPGKINVYHLHGYFQFIKSNIGDSTKEAPDIRVFTEQEFFDFFNRPNSLFSYTFLHLLREYHLLFIGMSLKDDNVRRLLHYSRTEMKESYEKEDPTADDAEEKSIRHYSIQEKDLLLS